MRPENSKLIKLLQEGVDDAIDRQIENDADRVFAGRMAAKLTWAKQRILELEAASSRSSWEGEVDRMGGCLPAQEIADSQREQW